MTGLSPVYKLLGITILAMTLLQSTTIYYVSGLGPGFNTVAKTPIISPNRDYLPANYTHHLNLIFRFRNAPQGFERETGIATTLIDKAKNLVRVYAFNSYTSEFVVLNLNVVTLKYNIVGIIKQYLNVSGREKDISFFKSGVPYILGSHDYKFGTVIVSTLQEAFLPIIEIYRDDYRARVRDAGPILINIIRGSGVDSYILDLGAVDNIGTYYPLAQLYGLAHTSLRLTDDAHLLIAQSTLKWPSIYAGIGNKYLDYVNGRVTSEIEYMDVDGVILAKIDLNSMNITNATYIYSPKYEMAAKGLVTSDKGFLTALLSENGTLISKFDKDLNIEWGLTLSFNKTITTTSPQQIYKYLKITETGDGYAILIPLDNRPLLIYLARDGRLKWVAYLDINGEVSYPLYNTLSGYKDRIYLLWNTKVNRSEYVWLTVFKTDGEVLGTYHNSIRVDAKAYLFSEVNGVLGEETTILCRPYGYVTRVRGYIDVSYLLKDYLAAELGATDPFRDFRTNEDDLNNGLGWKVYDNIKQFLHVSYNYSSIFTKQMKIILLGRAGDEIAYNIDSYTFTFKFGNLVTNVYDDSIIEFIPSFFYPLAIMPDEVDFGTIHVGETKEVYLEMIWLVQLGPKGTSDAIGWHRLESEDPSFHLDEKTLRTIIFEWSNNTDIDVGKRLRVKIIFNPREEGLHTSTFGIGQGPNGIYVWSPIGFDQPRQIIPVRGLALAEYEAITIGRSSIKLALSAIEISAPSHVIPGSAWRETLYITNIGNMEAVFVHGILVLPTSIVIDVKGADEVLDTPNSTSLEPFFAVVSRIKPMETRRIDIILRMRSEIADPKSPWSIFLDESIPHGVIPLEMAALPPWMWQKIWEKLHDMPDVAAEMAMDASNMYIKYILMSLANKTIDEANNELVNLWLENPVLANYLDSEANYLALQDWLFNRTMEKQIMSQASTSSVIESGPSLYAKSIIGQLKNGLLEKSGHFNSELDVKSFLDNWLAKALGVQGQEWQPNAIWFLKEFFKPDEFVNSIKEEGLPALVGAGKGIIQALSLDIINLKTGSETEEAAKVFAYWATNVVTLLEGVARAPKLLEQALRNAGLAFESGRKALAQALRIIEAYKESGLYLGPQRFWKIFSPGFETVKILGKEIKLPRILDRFMTLYGIEGQFLDPVRGVTAYGNILKLAKRGNVLKGLYIGIGFNPGRLIQVGDKWVHPGVYHLYILSGKVVIPQTLMRYFNLPAKALVRVSGGYAEYYLPIFKPLLQSLYTGVLKPASLIIKYAITMGLDRVHISFSADPNEASISPYPYITSPTDEIYANVKFENLPNATAPAYNITVKLYIEGPANVSTIDLWDVSHPETYDYHLINITNDRIMVTVRFTNITLPPNKNPPEGEGWLTVKFRLLDTIKPGSKVRVYADVYFDYNPPVRTNVAESIYDPEPPDINIYTSIEKNTLHITGTISDDIAGYYRSVLAIIDENGTPINISISSTDTIDYQIKLNPGKYTVYIKAWDGAGNVNSSSLNVTISPVEETPPTTPTEKPEGGLPITYIATAVVAVIAILFVTFYVRRRRLS